MAIIAEVMMENREMYKIIKSMNWLQFYTFKIRHCTQSPKKFHFLTSPKNQILDQNRFILLILIALLIRILLVKLGKTPFKGRLQGKL